MAVPDLGTVESPITVSGRSGSAPSPAGPGAIRHTYRGDLQVDLVAPDGTAYRLKSAVTRLLRRQRGRRRHDLHRQRLLRGGNGTWRLRVRDTASGDTGFIDSWSLRF